MLFMYGSNHAVKIRLQRIGTKGNMIRVRNKDGVIITKMTQPARKTPSQPVLQELSERLKRLEENKYNKPPGAKDVQDPKDTLKSIFSVEDKDVVSRPEQGYNQGYGIGKYDGKYATGQPYWVAPGDDRKSYMLLRDTNGDTYIRHGRGNYLLMSKRGYFDDVHSRVNKGNQLSEEEFKSVLAEKPDFFKLQCIYEIHGYKGAQFLPKSGGDKQPVPIW